MLKWLYQLPRTQTRIFSTRATESSEDLQRKAIIKHGTNTLSFQTGNPETTKKILGDFAPTESNLKSVSVYYLNHIFKNNINIIPKLITDVPLIAVNGDQSIRLQNGTNLYSPSPLDQINKYNLISPRERRLSRKKVIASNCQVFGYGGFKSSMFATMYCKPQSCIIITCAGAQFETYYLEYIDFIIDKHRMESMDHVTSNVNVNISDNNNDEMDEPLFAHYYTNGIMQPSYKDVINNTGNGNYKQSISKIDNNLYLNSGAYFRSMCEDVLLYLHTFNDMVEKELELEIQLQLQGNKAGKDVKKKRKGYLKATAVGMGFFSVLPDMSTNISNILVNYLLSAYYYVLKNFGDKFEYIKVIEFPDFMNGYYCLNDYIQDYDDDSNDDSENINGIEIKHTMYNDLLCNLDFLNEQGLIVGVLNAGDCFCIPGNEMSYASVESMIGNNSDLRFVQSYIQNKHVLDVNNNYYSVNLNQYTQTNELETFFPQNWSNGDIIVS